LKEGSVADQEVLSQAMRRLARGSLLVMVALMFTHVFTFARRLIIVRSLSTHDYGLYSLGMTVLLMLSMVALFGLSNGCQRFVAYYRGRKDLEGARGAFLTSAILVSLTTLVVTAGLLALTGQIESLLKKPGLAWVLVMVALSLPLMTAITMVTALFQGFENVAPKVFFSEIGVGITTTLGVGIAAKLGAGLRGVMIAYVLGHLAIVLVALSFAAARFPQPLKGVRPRWDVGELLSFSAPVAIAAIAGTLLSNSDTLVIGFYKTAHDVGVYNAAVPVYRMLAVFIYAVGFIYDPVAARLIGQEKHGELRTLYPNVTKWSTVLTLPACFLCLFYPKELLGLLFGTRYVDAAAALQVLTLALLANLLPGQGGKTLLAYGRSRLYMLGVLLSAALNVALNFLLIPGLGITGAAAAAVVSVLFINAFNSIAVYKLYRIHPLTRQYLVPLACGAAGCCAIYYPLKLALGLSYWLLLAYFFIFMAITVGAVLLTRGVDDSDRALYGALKNKVLSMARRGDNQGGGTEGPGGEGPSDAEIEGGVPGERDEDGMPL